MTTSAPPARVTSSSAPTTSRTTRSARLAGRPLSEPARLRFAMALLVAGVVAMGIVVFRSATDRRSSADLVRATATPRLASAEDVYVKLADADASASTAFLRGHTEPLALRQRYDADLGDATRQLSTLAQGSTSAQARQAVDVINEQLPVYAGLIESARSSNRLDHPVGAAYLRSASALMRQQVLPATTSIYEDAANQADRGYRSGKSSSELVAVALVGLALLAAFVMVQTALAFETHRVLNVGLVCATVIVLGLSLWSFLAFTHERDALNASQRRGADTLQIVSTARILTLRSFSDDNLELIERGAVPEYMPDFDAAHEQVGGPHGLLAREAGIAATQGGESRVAELSSEYADFVSAHAAVRHDEAAGSYLAAVRAAAGPESSALARVDSSYASVIDDARAQLVAHADAARGSLGGLAIAAVVLSALAALLIVMGLRRRIQEYS